MLATWDQRDNKHFLVINKFKDLRPGNFFKVALETLTVQSDGTEFVEALPQDAMLMASMEWDGIIFRSSPNFQLDEAKGGALNLNRWDDSYNERPAR